MIEQSEPIIMVESAWQNGESSSSGVQREGVIRIRLEPFQTHEIGLECFSTESGMAHIGRMVVSMKDMGVMFKLQNPELCVKIPQI